MATTMQFNPSFPSFNGNSFQQQPQQSKQNPQLQNNQGGVLEPTPIDQAGRVNVVQKIDNLPMDLMMNCDEYLAALSSIQKQQQQQQANNNNIMDMSSEVEPFDIIPFGGDGQWGGLNASATPQGNAMFGQQNMSMNNQNQMGMGNAWPLKRY